MIEIVIKRDGREEEYIPAKVSDWGKWMSKQFGANWIPIVQKTERRANAIAAENDGKIKSSELQEILIDECLRLKDYKGYMMAGKLFGAELGKIIYKGEGYPSLKEIHSRMAEAGILKPMDYTEEEMEDLNNHINHKLDLLAIHYSTEFFRIKYSLKDLIKGVEYETPQFTLMRMAMALAVEDPNRVEMAKMFYDMFSGNGLYHNGHIPMKLLSAPSPNYTNLGTYSQTYASCLLYQIPDTIPGLTAAMSIAHEMTAAGAGLGASIRTRSLGDGVRGGTVIHQGKLPYLKVHAATSKANKQQSRGGALNIQYGICDPEVETLIHLRNPRTPAANRNRDIHFGWMDTTFIAEKVAKNESVFLFNDHSAPDLAQAFFSGDDKLFRELYAKYEADDSFKKTYRNARDLVLAATGEGIHTGTVYYANLYEMNHHTPFKEYIDSSNLCMEITQPKHGYTHPRYLYDPTDHGQGEASTCNLGGINVSFLDFTPENDELYAKAAYTALKMIDRTINLSKFPFEHLNFTSRQRMNAGVGVMGVATLMARNKMKYTTEEGRNFMHRIAERHSYHLIRASLRISKERGLAPWIHKTKWPEGWLPIDTYNRGIDDYVSETLHYDWEQLRSEIIENGGIGHSALVAIMPGESSSKALGASNSIYPVREEVMIKTDGASTIRWAAYQEEGIEYQSAWDVHMRDMILITGIWQKFTDQAISADLHHPLGKGETISSTELIELYLLMHHVGMKTRYYFNTRTVTDNSEEAKRTVKTTFNDIDQDDADDILSGFDNACDGGGCTL